MKHYHAHFGSIGCLADDTSIHETKKSAVEEALDFARDHNEARPGHRIPLTDIRRIQIGYCTAEHCTAVIEVNQCQEEDCFSLEF